MASSTDEFGFGSVLPFDSDMNDKATATTHKVEPAWDTSRELPSLSLSPSSPSSVFNFFSADGNDDDDVGALLAAGDDSNNESLWGINDF